MGKTVIIGGVAGGAGCAARLRRLDEHAEIVVLERGPYISYANCGLPYAVSGVIGSRSALLLQTPESMRRRYRVDVRVKQEVIAIHREKKTVTVRELESGRTYEEGYDTLVLATGSSPVRPAIPGATHPRIRTLWTVPDAEGIRALTQGGLKTAAVVGGGFIGLELAENLRQTGTAVTLLEAAEQVMPPLDGEMAKLLHRELERHGVRLLLGQGVRSFSGTEDGVEITTALGTRVSAELVLLCVGVAPNSALAKDAGLRLGVRGSVVTDGHMRTSDPNIYAVGDVAQVREPIFGGETVIPLAGPANKQARIAADNIAGGNRVYAGTYGTCAVSVFDLTAAAVGINERALQARGLLRGRDYETVTVIQNSHAGYYPGATPMTLKLLFSMDGNTLYGGQIVGRDGVDKRIDSIAVTMRLKGGVRALTELELAYAPSYSSAKDPVNMAGFMAENVLAGLAQFAPWDVLEEDPSARALDVREASEVEATPIPGAIHIPLGSLREQLEELDRAAKLVVFCAAGVRAHNAARILRQRGFSDVTIYPGGVRFYRATHSPAKLPSQGA